MMVCSAWLTMPLLLSGSCVYCLSMPSRSSWLMRIMAPGVFTHRGVKGRVLNVVSKYLMSCRACSLLTFFLLIIM